MKRQILREHVVEKETEKEIKILRLTVFKKEKSPTFEWPIFLLFVATFSLCALTNYDGKEIIILMVAVAFIFVIVMKEWAMFHLSKLRNNV